MCEKVEKQLEESGEKFCVRSGELADLQEETNRDEIMMQLSYQGMAFPIIFDDLVDDFIEPAEILKG